MVPLPKLPPAYWRPASAFVAFKRDAYVVTEGEITKFTSSPGGLRGFCARCGSTMTCEGEGLPEIQFHIGTFTYEDASRLRPTKQFFPEERLPWVRQVHRLSTLPAPASTSRRSLSKLTLCPSASNIRIAGHLKEISRKTC